ncbi:hypothetical protein WME88_54235 [Sorangium sp. So ce216]
MAQRTIKGWADLLGQPAKVQQALDRLAEQIDGARPGKFEDLLFGLSDRAARALLLGGPDACREPLARAAAPVADVVDYLGPSPGEHAALLAKEAASFARVAECAGVAIASPPVAGWLDMLGKAACELPEIRTTVTLLALGEGRFELARKLVRDRPPPSLDPGAPLAPGQRQLLLDLIDAAEAKAASPELLARWELTVRDYHAAPVSPSSFRMSDLFLVARVLHANVEGVPPGGIAQRLHELVRKLAGAP